MSRTVTVGVDGSRESLAAADWAADEALVRRRPLRLVHVWSHDAGQAAYCTGPEALQRSAETLLDAAAQHVLQGHPDVQLETSQLRGAPEEVLGTAAETADVLVLGSRGLGGLTGFVVGSVSLAVLASVRRPVILVRASTAGESAPASPPGDVVLGLDLPRASQDALAFAFGCADRYGCGLRIAHSWSMPPVYGLGTTDVVPLLMDEVAVERTKAMDTALAPWVEKHPAVAVARQVAQGRPAQDLVAFSYSARLVVVGLRSRRSRLGAHIGPVVHSLLHHTAAPVAVVPHD